MKDGMPYWQVGLLIVFVIAAIKDNAWTFYLLCACIGWRAYYYNKYENK
jgi:hypothetical protein